MPDRRRDSRVNVELPYVLTDLESSSEWHCRTVDISPTGIQLEVDDDNVPAEGAFVNVTVQGKAEAGWEHINTRRMRVVRIQGRQISLAYVDE